MEYIVQFRQIISQVEEMTGKDQIIYFQRGLRQQTQEEAQYRRGTTLSEVITGELDFERAYLGGHNKHASTTLRSSAHYVAK